MCEWTLPTIIITDQAVCIGSHSVESVVEGKRSRQRMGFRGELLLALALFVLAIDGTMGKKTFEQFEGFKIDDPNSIIDSYPEVDQETCEVTKERALQHS